MLRRRWNVAEYAAISLYRYIEQMLPGAVTASGGTSPFILWFPFPVPEYHHPAVRPFDGQDVVCVPPLLQRQ